MNRRFAIGPTLVTLFFLSFTTAATAAQTQPWLNLKLVGFHLCAKNCQAHAAVTNLRPFKPSATGQQNPLAIQGCTALRGKMDFVSVGGRMRGMCMFKDGSGVELVGLQAALEEKGLR